MLHDLCAILCNHKHVYHQNIHPFYVKQLPPWQARPATKSPVPWWSKALTEGTLQPRRGPEVAVLGRREGALVYICSKQIHIYVYIYINIYIYIHIFMNIWKICMKTCISNHESQYISKKTNMCFILIHSFQYIVLNLQVIFKFHIQDVHQNSQGKRLGQVPDFISVDPLKPPTRLSKHDLL